MLINEVTSPQHSSSSVPSEGHMITRQADDEFLRSESPATRHFLTTSVEVHSEHQPPSQLFSSLRLRKQKRSTGHVRLSLNTSAPATELITQISDEERSLAAVVTAEDNSGDDDISDDSNSNHEEFVSLVEESDTHRQLKQVITFTYKIVLYRTSKYLFVLKRGL